MAERVQARTAALLASAMDTGSVRVERDGLSTSRDARFGLVMLDEGLGEDEVPPTRLLDRCAFFVGFDGIRAFDWKCPADALQDRITEARQRLPNVDIDAALSDGIVDAGLALGISSLRAALFAVTATRCVAALDVRDRASEADAARACQLVYAHRARAMPQPTPDDAPEPQETASNPDNGGSNEMTMPTDGQPLSDKLVSATLVTAGVLFAPGEQTFLRQRQGLGGGRSGAPIPSDRRGRPTGARRGDPRRGGRIDLVATLKGAAPFQSIRQKNASRPGLQIRPSDFRIKRFRGRTETVVIFLVDASGSAAYARMAEAKGAVEYLLSDCYTRRDHVALIAFRDRTADLLLPPTRSLTRVKRTLASLPGGGGTPLAAGLGAGLDLAQRELQRGRSPLTVLLSDGRGNIARNGEPGRHRARDDAASVARVFRSKGLRSLVIDTGKRPGAAAADLAVDMGAAYRALPRADSQSVSDTVRAVLNRDIN